MHALNADSQLARYIVAVSAAAFRKFSETTKSYAVSVHKLNKMYYLNVLLAV